MCSDTRKEDFRFGNITQVICHAPKLEVINKHRAASAHVKTMRCLHCGLKTCCFRPS
eukprot:NODE_287_length_3219_cov_5.158797.p14 GENE.NODE_287_length_3219_cov_5.158797~~NODE_287_length_3219_cov_5.158797.p14  ORF type:complete len:57 (+),score=1.57 NODE_287_length_3219_cov_5.158797:1378-1548(+)